MVWYHQTNCMMISNQMVWIGLKITKWEDWEELGTCYPLLVWCHLTCKASRYYSDTPANIFDPTQWGMRSKIIRRFCWLFVCLSVILFATQITLESLPHLSQFWCNFEDGSNTIAKYGDYFFFSHLDLCVHGKLFYDWKA